MDSRIFYFSKWILPKTNSLFSQNTNEISVGYFDFVKVEKIKCIENTTPLEEYAKNKNQFNGLTQNENLELTKQEFFVFTNTGEENIDEACYNQEKVDDFWENECFIRFYSFLHISEGKNKESIYNLVKNINRIFGQANGETYNTLCYFSLDYSDIIICSKCESILEYSKAVFTLNYNQNIKLVRDSFSLISISNEYSKKIHQLFLKDKKTMEYSKFKEKIIDNFGELKCFNDTFNLSLNLGIQNYNVFVNLEKELIEYNIKFKKYKLLGRHDITINNNEADLIWLIVVQNIIDSYSTEDLDKELSYENVIFNCETYMRLPFSGKNETYSDSEVSISFENKKYNLAKEKLKNTVEVYLDNEKLKIEHKTPVYALYFSLLGLLKNGFAEDFVICIYRSFISFLEYMAKKIEQGKYEDLDFDRCFNSYFDNITALTNSAMHSDRQFIQSPSFNPVFYDLPPKLMAYYTAVTNMEINILNTGDNGNYSFMFRPSFSRDIKITSFSYNEFPPADRLLAVTINETDLYSPFEVISQMCHEAAHYVGDENRNRCYRKEVFLKCILYDIIYTFIKCEKIKYSDKIETSINTYIRNIILSTTKEPYYENSDGYSTDFYQLLFSTINSIYTKQKHKNLTKKLFKACLPSSDIVSVSCVCKDFDEYLINICSQILNESIDYIQIGSDIKILKSILSETYADMQMILILDLSLDEYLFKFKNILTNPKALTLQNETYSRLFNIIMFFTLNKKWNIIDTDSEYYHFVRSIYYDIYKILNYIPNASNDFVRNLYGKDYLDYNLLSDFSAFKSYWKSYEYWNIGIQMYLSKVYNSSIQTYSTIEKKAKIEELNKKTEDVKKFADAVSIFTSIQALNEEFAEELYT